ncbi:rRNA small subunit methyltransferase 1 [Candidatus Collierbacteria bacterium]|nr:rRNA small subunit methyltransferase 1 [Candidatus Collierbacteria bacterium]
MSTGTLYIVSTPIGNLDDLAPRAKQILESSAYVLCESTDQTRKLTSAARLKKYVGKGSSGTSVMSQAIDDLKSGSDISLVCNAGTPLISDPGLALVEIAVACGIPVRQVPGFNAALSAAVTSGLPTKRLILAGFLPKKSGAQNNSLEKLKNAALALDEPAGIVIYCSKYQVLKTIENIAVVFGEGIKISLAREMTKMFEEHKNGIPAELINWLNENKVRLKGEFTLVIEVKL